MELNQEALNKAAQALHEIVLQQVRKHSPEVVYAPWERISEESKGLARSSCQAIIEAYLSTDTTIDKARNQVLATCGNLASNMVGSDNQKIAKAIYDLISV